MSDAQETLEVAMKNCPYCGYAILSESYKEHVNLHTTEKQVFIDLSFGRTDLDKCVQFYGTWTPGDVQRAMRYFQARVNGERVAARRGYRANLGKPYDPDDPLVPEARLTALMKTKYDRLIKSCAAALSEVETLKEELKKAKTQKRTPARKRKVKKVLGDE